MYFCAIREICGPIVRRDATFRSADSVACVRVCASALLLFLLLTKSTSQYNDDDDDDDDGRRADMQTNLCVYVFACLNLPIR